MAVTSEIDGSPLVLTPHDGLDYASIIDFRDAYSKHLYQARRICVDLSQVSRLNYCSLAILMALKESAAPRRILIAGAEGHALTTLAMVNFEQLFDIDRALVMTR